MEHLEGCDFKDRIKKINCGSWYSGKGEISGYINVEEKEIYFDDGWNSYPSIPFNFCPVCGVRLNEKGE